MDGSQPVSQVTLQMLNSLIDTQTRLRDAAEARWEAARAILFKLASLVAADWLERKQHEKGGLNVIRMEELAEVISQRVSALEAISKLPEAGKLEKASQRIEELNQLVNELTARTAQGEKGKQELESAVQKQKSLLEENERLKRQAEKLKANSTSVNSEVTIPAPAWFMDWAASGGFEKQSYILKLIGSTGISLR